MEREEQKERERRGRWREGARPKSIDPRPTMLLRVEYPVRVQCTEPAQLAYLMPLAVSLSLPPYLSLPLLHCLSLSCTPSLLPSPALFPSLSPHLPLFLRCSVNFRRVMWKFACGWLFFDSSDSHTHTHILSYIFDVYMVDTDIGICIYRACAINTCLGKFADQVQLFLSFFLALLCLSCYL